MEKNRQSVQHNAAAAIHGQNLTARRQFGFR